MHIGGIEKFSLLDFPGRPAAVIFTQGCNFRCGYCHNPELVYPSLFQPLVTESEVFEFLESRRGKLDGVVITGGEPTIQEDLIPFIKKIREMGFAVKLDTNGMNPRVLAELIAPALDGDVPLVDYLAMDIKGPLKKYERVACAVIDPANIKESIRLIMASGIDYEFRTTVVRSQLMPADFPMIGRLIRGARLYALQRFVVPSMYKIANQSFLKEKTYDDKEFDVIRAKMERYVARCVVR
jgi:pyruvate formate lyase activating enzyme